MLPLGRMAASRQSMRVAALLTRVMAWLMTGNAVHAGETSRKDLAPEDHRLSGRSIFPNVSAIRMNNGNVV